MSLKAGILQVFIYLLGSPLADAMATASLTGVRHVTKNTLQIKDFTILLTLSFQVSPRDLFL